MDNQKYVEGKVGEFYQMKTRLFSFSVGKLFLQSRMKFNVVLIVF